MPHPPISTVINIAGFYVVWLLLVAGAGYAMEWLGLVALAIWLPVHFRLSDTPREDAWLLIVCLMIGPPLDAILMSVGFIHYNGWSLASWLPPVWIFALWALFGTYLSHTLRFLRTRMVLAVLFGAIGGPAAYWAGVRLGAAEMLEPVWLSYLAVAAGWGLITPALACIAPHHIDGRVQLAREVRQARRAKDE